MVMQTKAIGILYLVNTCALGISTQLPKLSISPELKQLAAYCDKDWEKELIESLDSFNRKYFDWKKEEEKKKKQPILTIDEILANDGMTAEEKLCKIQETVDLNKINGQKVNNGNTENLNNEIMDIDIENEEQQQIDSDYIMNENFD